jgi:hypothetical protein
MTKINLYLDNGDVFEVQGRYVSKKGDAVSYCPSVSSILESRQLSIDQKKGILKARYGLDLVRVEAEYFYKPTYNEPKWVKTYKPVTTYVESGYWQY